MTEAMPREQRQAFELLGVANADLKHPTGSPREMRRLRAVLQPSEKPETLFLVYHGLRPGLGLFTDSRFAFVFRAALRRRPIAVPYASIQRVRVTKSVRYDIYPTIHLELDGGEEQFWVGTDPELDAFLGAWQEHVGDRLIDDRSRH